MGTATVAVPFMSATLVQVPNPAQVSGAVPTGGEWCCFMDPELLRSVWSLVLLRATMGEDMNCVMRGELLTLADCVGTGSNSRSRMNCTHAMDGR